VVGKEFLIDPYFDHNDNLWYLIEVNLTAHETVIIRQRFEITRLNIIVNNLEEYESSSYRAQKYDKYRDMYLAQETEHEVLSPELIALSKKIVDGEDSPLIKAERIYEWIGDNIEYDKAYKGGGALNTYLEGKGTCGDYTDLMITLLRMD
jgi:transglutaminase-like putative cysteine protease